MSLLINMYSIVLYLFYHVIMTQQWPFRCHLRGKMYWPMYSSNGEITPEIKSWFPIPASTFSVSVAMISRWGYVWYGHVCFFGRKRWNNCMSSKCQHQLGFLRCTIKGQTQLTRILSRLSQMSGFNKPFPQNIIVLMVEICRASSIDHAALCAAVQQH